MMDDPLKEQFQALREEESDSLPNYSQILTRQRSAPNETVRSLDVRGAIPALFIAAMAIWLLLPMSAIDESPTAGPILHVRWAMPTDVLLSTPGSELLRNFPSVGTGALLSEPLMGSGTKRGIRG
jgi:hypothetical protein